MASLDAAFLRSASTEEIAMAMLRSMGGEGNTVSAWNTMNGAAHRLEGESSKDALVGRMSDGWAWLVAHGCVGPSTSHTGDWSRITRRGAELAADPNALPGAWASERLAGGLLPALDVTARPAFERGDYETASFAAMKAVEVEVRRLGGFDSGLVGTKLMQEAFKNGGVLTDPHAEAGEQVATQLMFTGSIGAFKNPASHRTVEFTDPIEAAEVVQLADLLLRILQRISIRLGGGT